MFCTKCGAKNEDQTKFCVQCGTQLKQPSAASMIGETKEKKKGKFNLIFILAAILIIGSGVAMAKDSVFRMVAPKAYIGSVFSKTLSQISKEISSSHKELLGVALTEKDDFTIGLSGVIDSMSSTDSYNDYSMVKGMGIDTNIAVQKSKKQLLGQFRYLYKDNPLLSANLFLNDEELGINIPELFDQYWTAQTEKFGQKWNDSYFGNQIAYMRLNDSLDISFSRFMDSSNQGITEETKKETNEATKELIKKSQLGEVSSTSVTIDNKSVKARELPIIIQGGELKSYLVDILKIYSNDENLKKQISTFDNYGNFLDGFDDFIGGFKDYINIRGDIVFKVVEYKGVIVKFSIEKDFEADDQDAELRLTVNFKNSKALINEFAIELEIESDGETLVMELNSKGNHIPQKGQFTDNTRMVVSIPYEDKIIFENECSISMKKGTIDGSCKYRFDDEGLTLNYAGKYNNSKALKVSLDDVSININAYDEQVRIRGGLDFSLERGAKDSPIDISDKKYILDLDEYQYDDYLEDANIYKRMDQIEDKFYEIMNVNRGTEAVAEPSEW